jgi:quercetin dioxygenase-like cupin family protein
MRMDRIERFKNGWFIGDFEPSLVRSKDVEISLMHHKKGAYIPLHYHHLVEEINVFVSGSMLCNGTELKPGDIFIFEKDEVSDCIVHEDSTIVVVKMPSIIGDKYNV